MPDNNFARPDRAALEALAIPLVRLRDSAACEELREGDANGRQAIALRGAVIAPRAD